MTGVAECLTKPTCAFSPCHLHIAPHNVALLSASQPVSCLFQTMTLQRLGLLSVFSLLVAIVSVSGMMLGGVSDAEIDEHTNEVAGFAVQQLNSNSNFAKDGQLKLGKVVSAKRQVVAGINHMLTIETTDASGKVQTVEVTVWEKPAYNKPTNEPPMELTKFKVVGAGPIAEVRHAHLVGIS